MILLRGRKKETLDFVVLVVYNMIYIVPEMQSMSVNFWFRTLLLNNEKQSDNFLQFIMNKKFSATAQSHGQLGFCALFK